MTLKNIKKTLEKTGYLVAYHHFKSKVKAPFIVYLVQGTNNVGADNKVWQKVNGLRIELYTDKKDISAEKKLEDTLDEAGIFYLKSENWIESEELYEIIYESEVVENV